MWRLVASLIAVAVAADAGRWRLTPGGIKSRVRWLEEQRNSADGRDVTEVISAVCDTCEELVSHLVYL